MSSYLVTRIEQTNSINCPNTTIQQMMGNGHLESIEVDAKLTSGER